MRKNCISGKLIFLVKRKDHNKSIACPKIVKMPYNCWYKARFCLLAKTVLKAGREFFKRLKSTRLENCWFRNQQTREKELVKDLLHHCHTLHLSNEFIRFKIKFSDFSWHCWLCWICQFAKSGNYFLSSKRKNCLKIFIFLQLTKKGSSEICQERFWIHTNGPWRIRLGKVHIDKFVIFDRPLPR